MAKRKYDLSVVILTLTVILLPIMGSSWDKSFVCYFSLFFALLAFGARVVKSGRICVTKTFLAMLLIGILALTELFWISDKGSQFQFACVFFTGALLGAVVNDIKKSTDSEKMQQNCQRVIYISALIYALCALLHQFFIESNLFFGKMDFNKGSANLTAIVMLSGIMACLRLFYGKKKSLGFYPSLVFMGFVFVMTGSLKGYLILGAIFLFVSMGFGHKRLEAFISLVVVVILSVLNIFSSVAAVVTKGINPQGAFRGVVSIIGIGKGGYNALSAVLENNAGTSGIVFLEIMEVFGVIGIAFLTAAIAFPFVIYLKNRNAQSLFMFMGVLCLLLSSSEVFCAALPLFAIFYSLCEEGKSISVCPVWGTLAVVPMAFLAFFTVGRISCALGQNAYDYGSYSQAAEFFKFGAECEMFNSDGWERAYLASERAEEQSESLISQREYLEKAIKFNEKNYLYRKYLAEVYTREGNVEEALSLWENIISRYDKESLYEEYAEKICDVMEKGNTDLERMEQLYNTIAQYADKATDNSVKLKVNNVLVRSQQYYIAKREGVDYIYRSDITEEATEYMEVPE